MDRNVIYIADCKQGLKTLPADSVDCCITSPPYYGLRDYGEDAQIGLEPTTEEYISKLVEVFTEVFRVLKPTGTLWVNVGDSYAGSGKGAAQYPENAKKYKQGTNRGTLDRGTLVKQKLTNIKPKDLIGIPWMLAFALRGAGWYLRQDIIWHKPNAMPESVKDRCGKGHEYIFLLSKSATYHFDYEAIQQAGELRKGTEIIGGNKRRGIVDPCDPMYRENTTREYKYTGKSNKRSVWTVPVKPFTEAHFATFPDTLIVDCIKAGCPEGGIVLDPFMGAGTTAIVARKLGRDYIGFELNPEYVEISNQRIAKELGFFQ